MGLGFEDLDVYRQARLLRQRVYKLTKRLPLDEKFGLVPQMRRAAVSMRIASPKDTGAEAIGTT
jgi:hypothetical protein